MFLEEAAARRCGLEVILGCIRAAVGSNWIMKKSEYCVFIQGKVSSKCGTGADSYTGNTSFQACDCGNTGS